MGFLSELFVPAQGADMKRARSLSGSPNSPLRHIPSFNDFLGDAVAPEAEAESTTYSMGAPDGTNAAAAHTAAGSPASPPVKPDVWRSVFDPGSNINMHRVGRRAFDTVSDPKRAPSTWDYILKAESQRNSFQALDAGEKGYIDRADLQAAFDHKYDTGRLMDQADTDGDGRISHDEFDALRDSSA